MEPSRPRVVFFRFLSVACALVGALAFLWAIEHLVTASPLIGLEASKLVGAIEVMLISAGLCYVLFAKAMRVKEDLFSESSVASHSDAPSPEHNDPRYVLILTGVYSLISIGLYLLAYWLEKTLR